MKIRKDDIVVAITGADASAEKTGKVLHVFPERQRVIVEGFNQVKKALRKSQENPNGGFTEIEIPLHVSKIQLFCPECKRGVRTGINRADGKRVRMCKKCGHAFEG